mmetsp:Transcript_2971/g.10730  ORF Transcript_2971/g.10730 Transcript_2971/m.10730 type:complete len:118 (-) Transcript_2971:141-494(-)
MDVRMPEPDAIHFPSNENASMTGPPVATCCNPFASALPPSAAMMLTDVLADSSGWNCGCKHALVVSAWLIGNHPCDSYLKLEAADAFVVLKRDKQLPDVAAWQHTKRGASLRATQQA